MPHARARIVSLALLLGVLAPNAAALWQPAIETPIETQRDRLRRERAERHLAEIGHGPEAEPGELPLVDPDLVTWYDQTLNELASERMGGRLPGSEGIELAASLIENHFQSLGLEPPFEETKTAPDGTEVIAERSSYRQGFERGNRSSVASARFSIAAGGSTTTGVLDDDFSVLGLSGTADFDGPVTFVGYSVVSGPGGYLGYPPVLDLDGRAALVLRFEPMDDAGRSKWSGSGWSFAASLQAKVGAAVRRNASAVLVVNPPHADDPRVGRLENLDSTGGPVTFEIPVLMITPELADKLVRAGDPEGRSLDTLTALANDGSAVVALDDDVTVHAAADVRRDAIITSNIGAVLPGHGSLAGEYVVIGAHYDHIGTGLFASRDPDRAGEIHPGADDNASGATGLMLGARLLSERYQHLPPDADARSILFLAFSAEESGLIGSRYYADHPAVPLADTVAMLNMDMIGRLRGGKLEIGGDESSPDLAAIAQPHFDDSGLVISDAFAEIGAGRSDHASFEAKEIPNLFFFTGMHDEYHTADDVAELVNDEGAVRVATLVSDIAYDLATRESRPAFEEREGSRRAIGAPRRPRVRVGIVPADDPAGGFRVERVFDGTSASDAGLRVGDRITKWNGEDIADVDAWMPVLLDHNPGDVVTLTVERDGEEVELEMTLKAPG